MENGKQFRADIERAIRKTIANLDRGTVGISQDCLWQLTVRKIASNHAPGGTNAGWIARQVFNQIVDNQPYCKFVYK